MPSFITDDDLERYRTLGPERVSQAIATVKQGNNLIVEQGKLIVESSERFKELIRRQQKPEKRRKFDEYLDKMCEVLGEKRPDLEQTFEEHVVLVKSFRRSLDTLVDETSTSISQVNEERLSLEDSLSKGVTDYSRVKGKYAEYDSRLTSLHERLASLTPRNAEYSELRKKIMLFEGMIREAKIISTSVSQSMKMNSERTKMLEGEQNMLHFKHFYCRLVRDSTVLLENHLVDFRRRFYQYVRQRETLTSIEGAYQGMHNFTHAIYLLFCKSSQQTADILTRPGKLDEVFRDCGDLCSAASDKPRAFYASHFDSLSADTERYLDTGNWR